MRKAKLDNLDQYFRNYLVNDCAVSLLNTHMKVLLTVRGKFVGTHTLSHSLSFVSRCYHVKELLEMHLKPFIEKILFEVCIPILKVTQKELNLFEEDPTQYINIPEVEYNDSCMSSKSLAK